MPQIPVTTRLSSDRPLVKIDNNAVPNPAAGQGFSITVPVGYRAQPVSLFFTMVTDANVANRFFVLDFVTSSGVVFRSAPAWPQTASETRSLCFAAGVSPILHSVTVFSGLQPVPPGFTLQEGDSIVLSVTGIQAGDQISLVNAQLLSQFVAE